MPRIPTIFDDTLLDTFDQLFKVAQEWTHTSDLPELASKLLDNILAEAQNNQAPTAANFDSPDTLIDYLKTNNIQENGQPIVYSQSVKGYAPYKNGNYINVEGLKTFLARYKNAAQEQGNMQGQYFIQAIDSLVTTLQTTKGFENINVVPVAGAATQTPTGQAATSNIPEKPQQAGQGQAASSSAAVAQFEQKLQSMGGSTNMIWPLPPQGQGMFDVDGIYAGMRAFYSAMVGTPIARELGSKIGSMYGYVNEVQRNASAFKAITNDKAEFRVSGNDGSQTFHTLDLMFNQNRAPGGPATATADHYGDEAAIQALKCCEFIVQSVASFFEDLDNTSIDGRWGQQVSQQKISAGILAPLFNNVSQKFADRMKEHDYFRSPQSRPGSSGGNP